MGCFYFMTLDSRRRLQHLIITGGTSLGFMGGWLLVAGRTGRTGSRVGLFFMSGMTWNESQGSVC